MAILQNSSGFKVHITTTTDAPSALSSGGIGYIWYELDTDKVKTIVDTATGLMIKIIG